MREIKLDRTAIYTGSLILVNPTCPVQKVPKKEEMQAPFDNAPQILMQHRAAVMLRCLLSDIGAERQIIPVSGFRTVWEQQKIFADVFAREGEDFARKFVAVPECSEHETGLAIDLAEKNPKIDFIRPSFPDAGLCGIFRRRASTYGFVQRYQEGKEFITKIAPEPWHFRYVGTPHAAVMETRFFSLEEYITFLRDFTKKKPLSVCLDNCRTAEIYFVPFGEEETMVIALPEKNPYLISGNNMDGVVITIWNTNP